MSPHRATVPLAVLLFSLAGPTGSPQALAGERGPKQFGEVRPDNALVYFIRTSRFVGSARTQFIYADDRFMGVVKNGSYGFAYADPGEHLLWTNWTRVTKEIELVAGQTYYLDVWTSISIVDEARGKALIDEVGDFVAPAEDDRATAAKQIENRYERAKKKESRKEKAEVAPVVRSVAPPENVEGMLKVPANTPITLELLENVCSNLTSTGETVWFRLAEDAAIEGGVFLKKAAMVKGTVRQAEPAKGGGKEGILDIVVPALTAPDGSVLPTVGQILSSGEERGDAASASGVAFGVFGALSVKGRQAYHFAGEKFKVLTRQETWVHPAEQAGEGNDAVPESAPEARSRAASTKTGSGGDPVVKGQAPDPIEFRPKKGKVTETVEIDLDLETEPRDVLVYALSAWEIPEPVKALSMSRHGKGWQCTFKGWDFVRYMREGSGPTEIPVKMRGTLQDGRTFLAEATVIFSVDRD